MEKLLTSSGNKAMELGENSVEKYIMYEKLIYIKWSKEMRGRKMGIRIVLLSLSGAGWLERRNI